MTTRSLRVTLLFAAGLLGTSVIAADYTDTRSTAVKACGAINPSQSQSGLLFNPDGYRSFYVRSQCFQEAAVRFRDAALCAEVRERRSLISSSWGYSPARCRQLVAEAAAADRRELQGMRDRYTAAGMKLRDFRVERNGNGRDFDIIPAFIGTYGHGYTLTFEIVPPTSAAPVLLHRLGYYVDEKSSLRIYIPQATVKERFPGFSSGSPYVVRLTLLLDVGTGVQDGYWSPAFIEEVFPTRERSQAMTKQIAF